MPPDRYNTRYNSLAFPSALCSPNTIGQVVVSAPCNPPQPGDPSYELFAKERADALASLSRSC